MNRTKIDIDTKTIIRIIVVILGFGLAVLAVYNALSALLILGVSFFLALALNTPVSRIARRLPGKSRVGATALSYVAVIAILGAIVFLVIPPIVQQTAKFAQTVPSVVENATTQWQGLRGFIDEYNLQPQVDQAVQSVQNSASSWAGSFGQTLISGVGSVFAFLTALILVLVLTFLMLVEGPAWMKRIWSVYTNKERMATHRRIVTRIYGVVNGYVTGQLTVSATGATFAGLAVFVLSLIFPEVPSSLAFPTAAITFVLSLIPMFGATIGGVIVTALLAFNNIPAAIIYAVYFVVYQQVENNFISPHIQSRRIELSALAVLASVTIGLYMFGVVGGIIAIPIAGAVRILIEEYLEHRRKQHALTAKSRAKA
jgi:predicted PurR-regulated permease PerM